MTQNHSLQRQLNLTDAVFLGLGSIVGSGVFVSLLLVYHLVHQGIIPALIVAGLLALMNGLSTAQLAALYPNSGGTYDYAHRLLGPLAGRLAGSAFVVAKSASAATAALALQKIFFPQSFFKNSGALLILLLIAALVLSGVKRSAKANYGMVLVTLMSLSCFVFLNWDQQALGSVLHHVKMSSLNATSFFEAVALLFVAYTGYGRVATLGEEVVDPRKTIPKAIFVTLFVSLILYLGVALILCQKDFVLQNQTTLLHLVDESSQPFLYHFLFSGVATALLGVLLNLILGVSRVVFAMGRHGDLPQSLSIISAKGQPVNAVLTTVLLMISLCLLGDVKTTWSFSAFSVLIYYSLTNFSALKLNKTDRFYHPVQSWLGLLGCLGLVFWIDVKVMGISFFGLVLLVMAKPMFLFFRKKRI